MPTFAASDDEYCQACEAELWNVRFKWEYSGEERYCYRCLTLPIDNQPGKVFLDFMPECQDVTHRLTTAEGQLVGGTVRYRSVRDLYPVIVSKFRDWG